MNAVGGVRAVVDEAAGWLNERGYGGHDPNLWREGKDGDWVAVESQESTTQVAGQDKFFLNVGYVPALWWSWRSIGQKARLPRPEEGLVWSRIADPARKIPDSAWMVSHAAEGSAKVSLNLREVLDETLSHYERLLEPQTAWRHAVAEDFPAMRASWALVRACLLAAQGQTPQLRAALDDIAAGEAAHQPFADWAWAKAGAESGVG